MVLWPTIPTYIEVVGSIQSLMDAHGTVTIVAVAGLISGIYLPKRSLDQDDEILTPIELSEEKARTAKLFEIESVFRVTVDEMIKSVSAALLVNDEKSKKNIYDYICCFATYIRIHNRKRNRAILLLICIFGIVCLTVGYEF